MRFSQPHDRDRGPCLPTHHPRSRRAWPNSFTPTGLRPAAPPDLLAYLATIDDPRARAGRRHPLVAIFAIAAAAVLAGAKSMTAIAEWAADAPSPSWPRRVHGLTRPPVPDRAQ
jgi:DDE_Tnp_1-associated